MRENRKVRVIEGVDSEEFSLELGKSEVFFVEISKKDESETILGLDDWLFLGKRKSYWRSESKLSKNESSVLARFFTEVGKKEVLS